MVLMARVSLEPHGQSDHLHEGEVGRLLPLSVAVQHPREGQFRVEAAEEAVEGGRGWLVGGVGARGAVHRDRGVAGGGLAHPRAVGVAVAPGPRLQGVGARPGGCRVQLELARYRGGHPQLD